MKAVERAGGQTGGRGKGGCWGGTAQSALSQGWRVKELLAAIAIYCKLLPEATPVDRSWLTIGQTPVTTALAPGAAGLVPAEELARVCLSLMADHSEALLLRYYKAGAVPNQRFTGLHALYCAAFALNEFKGAPELLNQTDLALADYGNGMFYPDGAMLERSPNYNQGDARSIRELDDLLAGAAFTPGVSLLETKLALYDRTTAYMQRPLGDLPRMATYASKAPPALWESPAIVTSWRNTFLQGDFAMTTEPTATAVYQGMLDSGNPAPGATSVAFPYAGFYLMRNGWASKSHWLYFANTPPGRGHRQLDQNGIQISAFGRELLTCAGPPPYNPTFVVASQADDYNGFASYQGEGSSYKCNTVVVDGRSQNEGGIVNATVTNSTMPNPWFTSADFDYVEGTYSAGYGGEGVYNRFLPLGDSGEAINGITHKRAVIFLRHAGIWLVTDRMTPSDALSHSYRQVWNFPAGNNTYAGFLPSEVSTDMATLSVRTTSTNGPNVSLHHLGPRWVNLLTYSGSRTPYAGWWGSGIGGLRLETANVHAVLNGSGPQMFVTAIVPSDTGTTGPVNTGFTQGPLSTTSIVDRSFGLVNGSTVRFVEAQQAQTLQIGDRAVTATTLLIVTAADQSQRGLVIGSTTAGLPGAFAFTAGPGWFSAGATITTPDSFTWQTGGSFIIPSTADADAPNVALPPGPPNPLVVRDFKSSGAIQTITWSSNPGTRYQVEWTEALDDWSSGGRSSLIHAIDQTSTYTDSAPNVPARFYRVRQLP